MCWLRVLAALAAHEWRRFRWSPVWMIGLAAAALLAYSETDSSAILGYPTANQALYGFQLGASVLFGIVSFLLAAASMAADLDGPQQSLIFSRPIPRHLYVLGKFAGAVSFSLVVVVPVALLSMVSPLLHGFGRIYGLGPFLLVIAFCVLPMLCFCCGLAALLSSLFRRLILSFPVFLVYFFAAALTNRPVGGKQLSLIDFSQRLYPDELTIQVPLSLREYSFAGLLAPVSPAVLTRSLIYASAAVLLLVFATLALRLGLHEKLAALADRFRRRKSSGTEVVATCLPSAVKVTPVSGWFSEEARLLLYSAKMLMGRNLLAVAMISAGLLVIILTYPVSPYQTRESILLFQLEMFAPLLGVVIFSDLVAAEFEARRLDLLRVCARGPAWLVSRRLAHGVIFAIAACLVLLFVLRLAYTRFSIWPALGIVLPGMLFFGALGLLAASATHRSLVGYAVGTAAVILSLVLKQVDPLTPASFFQRDRLANGRLASDWNWLLAKVVFLAFSILLAWAVFRLVAKPAAWRRPTFVSLLTLLLCYTGLHWLWSGAGGGGHAGLAAAERDMAVVEQGGKRIVRRAVTVPRARALETTSLTDITFVRKGDDWEKQAETPVDLTREWHIPHLELEASVAPAKAELNLRAKFTLNCLGRRQDRLCFFLGTELRPTHLFVEGRPVAFNRTGDLIDALLESPATEGQEIAVTFEYSGRLQLPQGLRFEGNSPDLLFANSRWFPSLTGSGPGRKNRFTCTLEVRMPKAWRLAAGELIRQEDKENVFKWHTETLVDAVPLCIGRYKEYRSNYRNIPVTLCTFSVDQRRAERVLERAVQALSVFESAFGPYPFAAAAIVENPFQNSGGHGFASMVTIKPERLVKEHEQRLLDGYIPHELAHLWWGNSVPLWVAEGGAVYANFHFLEKAVSRRAALDFLDREFSPAINEAGAAPLLNGQGQAMYAKGGYLLAMLQRETGQAQLLAALKGYLRRHAEARCMINDRLSEDFINSLQQTAGPAFNEFVSDSIKTTKRFDPAINRLTCEPSGQGFDVALSLQYCGEVRFPVPVRLQFKDGMSQNLVWSTRAEEEILRLQARSPVLVAEIDPEHELLDWDRKNNHAIPGEPARAQSRVMAGWQTYTPGDGLPGLDVRCLSIGPGGRVYAGISSLQAAMNREWAVAVFEKQWRRFDPGTPPVDFVTSIAPAADDALWFGSQGHLSCVSAAAQTTNFLLSEVRAGGTLGKRLFRPHSYPSLPIPGSEVYCLLAGPEGQLWIGTDHGVSRLDPRTLKIRPFGPAEGLEALEIFNLAHDISGTLWAGTDQGLFSLSGEKWSRCGSCPRDLVLALAPDANGGIWCGTYRSGLVLVRGGKARVYSRLNAPLPDTIFSCLASDRQGGVWAGSPNGLVRFDGENWAVYSSRNCGLPSDQIRSLAIGDSGCLWVATAVGVARYVSPKRDATPAAQK